MEQHQYYPEEVLIEKMESGEYGWLDYVNHFSAEWQEEYNRVCKENHPTVGNDSDAKSGPHKAEQPEGAPEAGAAKISSKTSHISR